MTFLPYFSNFSSNSFRAQSAHLGSEFPEFNFDSLKFKADHSRFASGIFSATGTFFITHYAPPAEIYGVYLMKN
jgi:hypothetical protein